MYILLGKTGYIAEAFIKELERRKLDYAALSRRDVNYTDYGTFCKYLDTNWQYFTKGSTIINCAGYTGKPNVDACEQNKDHTILGNVVLPVMLSGVCLSRGIPLVHISSGCIYTGSHEFTEEDSPNFDFINGSFYSGTKELAERSIKDSPLCYIFRLRIPFDHEPSERNYLTKLLNYETLIDATNSLSHRGDFAKYCLELCESSAPYGIYNITNKGKITTREVVEYLKEIIPDKEFKFFKDYAEFEGVIKTPRSNCTLSTKKLEQYVNVRNVHDALEESVRLFA